MKQDAAICTRCNFPHVLPSTRPRSVSADRPAPYSFGRGGLCGHPERYVLRHRRSDQPSHRNSIRLPCPCRVGSVGAACWSPTVASPCRDQRRHVHTRGRRTIGLADAQYDCRADCWTGFPMGRQGPIPATPGSSISRRVYTESMRSRRRPTGRAETAGRIRPSSRPTPTARVIICRWLRAVPFRNAGY